MDLQKMPLPSTQLAGAARVTCKLLPKSKVSDIDCANTRRIGATQIPVFAASGAAGP